MKTKNIILLESNKAVVSQLKASIEEKGTFSLLYAGDDGDEGIKKILDLNPDLVIVSMFLKGTDGCGVIRAVKKAGNTAKIIATGVASDALIENAIKLGAIHYLVKPFTMQTAIERISEIINDDIEVEK